MKLFVIALAFSVVHLSALVGQDTLRDLVRRQQRPVEVRIGRQFSPADLADIARECDLVARVVVADTGAARLSSDERTMYTDFSVQVLEQLFPRKGALVPNAIVVRKPGGTMSIEGHMVTAQEADFPPFEINGEYIVFLKRDASESVFHVPFGAQGVFKNVGGVIQQVSRDTGTWNRTKGWVPVGDFVAELMTVLSAR